MGWKKNTPGCNASSTCSCATCLVADDNFNRANNADINASSPVGWQVDAGTFAIDSNKMKISTSDAYAKCLEETADMNLRLEVTTVSGNVADQTRILLGYVDDQESFVIELTQTYVMNFYTRSAGVDTLVISVCVNDGPGGTFTPTVWYDTNFDRVWVQAGNYYAVCVLSSPLTIPTVGLGTATLTSASVTNDDFKLRTVTPSGTPPTDCVALPDACTPCADSKNPANEVTVRLQSINTTGTCGATCTSLNGLYTLKFVGKPTPNAGWGGGDWCAWQYTFPSAICNYQYLYALAVKEVGTGNLYWAVTLSTVPNGYGGFAGESTIYWTGAAGGLVDCVSSVNEICTLYSASGDCAATGSTAKVTVL